jgi:RND family efflux transporter MFP subunit
MNGVNKMKQRYLSIAVFILLLSFLVSCGDRNAERAASETIDYREYASKIQTLSETLPPEFSERDARRYLSKVEKALRPLGTPEAQNDLTVVPVYVRTLEPEYIAQKVRYLGDITGDPSIVVYPKISEIITDIKVSNGDHVQKGEILAIIRDDNVRASKNQAEAAYLSAKSQLANIMVEYERSKTLFEAGAMSRSQWDQIVTQRDIARSSLRQAEASMELANTQLEYAKVTAPISGYVSGLGYESGDMATPQKAFAFIHQIGSVKVTIKVTERDLVYIRQGQRCEISVSAYPDTVFEGRVSNIAPVIDPQTRTAEVEIYADNSEKHLKPGMFARVSIVTQERENALTIEKAVTGKQTVLKRFGSSLRDDRPVETYHCFTVRDGMARKTPIEIGIESKTKYEVTAGLESGDLVVIMGQNNLSDSTLVEIVK